MGDADINVQIVEDDDGGARMVDGRIPVGSNNWMDTGIYRLQFPDGSSYIGSSVRASRRIANHLFEMKRSTHFNDLVQDAWNRHGTVSCGMVLICRKEDLLLYEQTCLGGLKPSLNLNVAGRRSRPLTEATRLKMSQSMKGKNTLPRTEEWKSKISKTLLEKGKVESRPQDVRDRIGQAAKAMWENRSPEEKAMIAKRSWEARRAKKALENG